MTPPERIASATNVKHYNNIQGREREEESGKRKVER